MDFESLEQAFRDAFPYILDTFRQALLAIPYYRGKSLRKNVDREFEECWNVAARRLSSAIPTANNYLDPKILKQFLIGADTKRELKKLAVQLAMEDFKFRIANESERIIPASAPVLIGYWDKMVDLVIRGRLTPETMREVLDYDGELKLAVLKAHRDWQKRHHSDD